MITLRGERTLAKLSPREQEVLLHLALTGHTNLETAKALYMSDKTVKVYLSRIYRILEVRSATQAIIFCWREGIVDATDAQAREETDGIGV